MCWEISSGASILHFSILKTKVFFPGRTCHNSILEPLHKNSRKSYSSIESCVFPLFLFWEFGQLFLETKTCSRLCFLIAMVDNWITFVSSSDTGYIRRRFSELQQKISIFLICLRTTIYHWWYSLQFESWSARSMYLLSNFGDHRLAPFEKNKIN